MIDRPLKVGPASQRHTGYPARATANERPLKREKPAGKPEERSGGDSRRPTLSWEASDQHKKIEAPPLAGGVFHV